MRRRGSFVLSSSAGAIYAGSTDPVVTETTAECPTTGYGRGKLRQEQLVRSFADRAPTQVTSLIARISTLYGPGQSAEKPQGLISHMARQIIRNLPIQIYVPLDTIRDYITVNDASTKIMKANRWLSTRSGVS